MLNYLTLNNLQELIQQPLSIVCVWAFVYYRLKIAKNNSCTIQTFRGVLLIVIIRSAASFLGLHTVAGLMDSIMNWGMVAVITISQPEIRSILGKIGKTDVFSHISTLTVNERENLIGEPVKAYAETSRTETGALISIGQGHSLSDYIETGTLASFVVSNGLLCPIFRYGAPLYDGAVTIQSVKAVCAVAYFPPTTRELPASYGAGRHAMMGVSETTGSITIVVSEETGNISVAEDGRLTVISETNLRELLTNVVYKQQSTVVYDNQGEPVEQTSTPPSYDSKRPDVFAHYFKGKNKRTEKEVADKCYTKKKKSEEQSKKKKDVVVVEQEVDQLHIEDLTQEQNEKLDALSEDIVADSEKEEESVAEADEPKPKRQKTAVRRKSTATVREEPQKAAEETEPMKKTRRKKRVGPRKGPLKGQTGKTIITNVTSDLFNDVIEPEAIVLYHVKADEDEETPEKAEERRGS